MFCLASFRLTRLIVFDEITSIIRRPFHEEVVETDEDGMTNTYLVIKGNGLRKWFGELISCYWCTGIWSSAILYGGWSIWPTVMETVMIILAIAGAASIIETIVLRIIDNE
ncbi:DUF1360 domain-containing protein [Bacillus suaedaesalsae]|uniref:DUF1360 domain-containing protein n=1 Tax=Bacillus suaedaesalsae TaxID=2810349 RepID=A0ABS2DI82_9BACI|nr:DUF1360 domain-containing protein [Bacillus suaedaesalsae]MBM6618190.1 DUF1360 domain-containing protein [Bacillus suaedaesalsae]